VVENAVRELPLRALVSPIIERSDLRAVLLELASEKVMVGRLAGDPVPVLCEDDRYTSGGHEISHAVHARTLEARPALPRVLHFFEDLVGFAVGVLAQSFYLLGE
jgi:hypothetical protein